MLSDGITKPNVIENVQATQSQIQQQLTQLQNQPQPTIVKASKDKKKINQKVREIVSLIVGSFGS